MTHSTCQEATGIQVSEWIALGLGAEILRSNIFTFDQPSANFSWAFLPVNLHYLLT